MDTMAGRPTAPPHDEAVVERVFEHRRIWRLTQDAFASAAALIAGQEPAPEVVLGIARGGVPLARLLAAHYGVPVVELTARHNRSDDLYLPATGQVELPEGSRCGAGGASGCPGAAGRRHLRHRLQLPRGGSVAGHASGPDRRAHRGAMPQQGGGLHPGHVGVGHASDWSSSPGTSRCRPART